MEATGHTVEMTDWILDAGTYRDLIRFREISGKEVLPWIRSKKLFQQAQKQRRAWQYIGNCGW